MIDVLEANLDVINSLIQWGGRMLSLVNLIKLDTIPLEVAAHLMSGMQKGTSVLIGAKPSWAGKTTLMGALLGVIPSSDRIITIENSCEIPFLPPGSQDKPKTYIIHEISRGGWHGLYLEGPPVVDVTRLVDPNTRLVTNLHADSIEGVKAIFRRFGCEKALNVFNFIIFIHYNPISQSRFVDEVWEFDKPRQSHKRIYSHDERFTSDFKNEQSSQKTHTLKWEQFLSQCLKKDIYSIEEVAYALQEYVQ